MKTPQFIKTVMLFLATRALYKSMVFDNIAKMTWLDLRNEERELLLLKYLLEKDDFFFDVGANIGVYTFMASSLIDESNIYAFEPLPKLHKRLRRSFHKVNIYKQAISEISNLKVDFKIPVVNSREIRTRATLLTSYREAQETASKIIQVETLSLDDFVRTQSINKVNLIKIDVEGYEFEVIKGSENVISRMRPILQVEIEQRHHNYSISKIFDHLKERAYTACFFDPHHNRMELLTQDPLNLQKLQDFKTPYYINNFFFFPNEKFAPEKLELMNQDITSCINRR